MPPSVRVDGATVPHVPGRREPQLRAMRVDGAIGIAVRVIVTAPATPMPSIPIPIPIPGRVEAGGEGEVQAEDDDRGGDDGGGAHRWWLLDGVDGCVQRRRR
jgi:hypothetical protein